MRWDGVASDGNEVHASRFTLHASPTRKAQRQSESEHVQPRESPSKVGTEATQREASILRTGPTLLLPLLSPPPALTLPLHLRSPIMVRVQIKGGVWKNTEDEILKAAISKYGMNVSRTLLRHLR
jgi:hypothetical protein